MSRNIAFVWLLLLGTTEAADVLTTGVGGMRGASEASPVAATLVATGGLLEFAFVKALLVSSLGLVLYLTWRWAARGAGPRWLYEVSLLTARLGAILAALVGLHNAVVLTTLPR